jgi:hypothetical protein
MNTCDYPPYSAIITILENCPSAIFTYIQLWKNRIDNEVSVKKGPLFEKDFTWFQNLKEHLFALEQQNLIQHSEDFDGYMVVLRGQTPGEGQTLC